MRVWPLMASFTLILGGFVPTFGQQLPGPLAKTSPDLDLGPQVSAPPGKTSPDVDSPSRKASPNVGKRLDASAQASGDSPRIRRWSPTATEGFDAYVLRQEYSKEQKSQSFIFKLPTGETRTVPVDKLPEAQKTLALDELREVYKRKEEAKQKLAQQTAAIQQLEERVQNISLGLDQRRKAYRTRPAREPRDVVIDVSRFALTHESNKPTFMLETMGVFLDSVAKPILEGDRVAAKAGMQQLGSERREILDMFMLKTNFGQGTCGPTMTNGEVLLEGYVLLLEATQEELAKQKAAGQADTSNAQLNRPASQ